MLSGKKLTDYTNLFSPHDFKKNDDIILSKMNESNSIEAIDKMILSKQTKFRLSKIIGIDFYQEINQRKSCSRKLNMLLFSIILIKL